MCNDNKFNIIDNEFVYRENLNFNWFNRNASEN